MVATLVGTGQLVMLAQRGVEPFAGLRRWLTPDVYLVLGLYAAGLVAGAVLQTPPALIRRARVAAGWALVLGLLAYAVPVGAITHILTCLLPPDIDAASTAGRAAPPDLDEIFLGVTTLGFAGLALTGTVFTGRPRPIDPTADLRARLDASQPWPLRDLVKITALASWLIATPAAALALIHFLLAGHVPVLLYAVVRLATIIVAGLLYLAVVIAVAVLRNRLRYGPRAPEPQQDVVLVLDRCVAGERRTSPHDIEVETAVEVRFDDGTVRVLTHRERGPMESLTRSAPDSPCAGIPAAASWSVIPKTRTGSRALLVP